MGVQIHSADGHLEERDWRQAVARGLKGRCPHCGRGRLFRAFLKPVDRCEVCGEDLHHQRADDLPPYIVITIVGHVVVGGLLLAEKYGDWPMWWHMALWPTLTIIPPSSQGPCLRMRSSTSLTAVKLFSTPFLDLDPH